jgi:hypothetical protein
MKKQERNKERGENKYFENVFICGLFNDVITLCIVEGRMITKYYWKERRMI